MQTKNLLILQSLDEFMANNINDPEKVGKELANKLKLQGADKILREIFEQFREN